MRARSPRWWGPASWPARRAVSIPTTSSGACRRGAAVRPVDRHLRPQEAVHDHARRLPGGYFRDRVRVDAAVLLRLPVRHRDGNRRRVQRDQLSDRQVIESTGATLNNPDDSITVRQRKALSLTEVLRGIIVNYPKRFVLGISLFVGQAFLYNAILFGYATLLSKFFGVATANAPYYLVAFAVGNLLGPIILGPLFDSIGRKPMIAGTYILSGVLLLITGILFKQHQLTAGSLTVAWSVVFFFASAGVSAAYLTVSEIFPMETRALAIALFYALGTGLGGIIGPQLFGRLIPTGKTSDVFVALAIGAGLMIIGGLVEILFGVKAERRRLEGIARPLTAVESAVRSGVAKAGAASAAAIHRPAGGTASAGGTTSSS